MLILSFAALTDVLQVYPADGTLTSGQLLGLSDKAGGGFYPGHHAQSWTWGCWCALQQKTTSWGKYGDCEWKKVGANCVFTVIVTNAATLLFSWRFHPLHKQRLTNTDHWSTSVPGLTFAGALMSDVRGDQDIFNSFMSIHSTVLSWLPWQNLLVMFVVFFILNVLIWKTVHHVNSCIR